LPAESRRSPHPFVYTILTVPYGASGGFVSVALAYLATKHGLTVQQGAELIAVMYSPQVFKVLWAPIADTTLSRRQWYLWATLVNSLGTVLTAAVPLGLSNFRLIEAIIFVTSIADSFVGFSVEAMIAHLTPAADRGRVSGWYQAGNLGGAGIGGGLGLWLLNTLPASWETGLILGGLLLACALPLRLLPDVPADTRTSSVVREIGNVVWELWLVARTRSGVLCVTLCCVPMCTGAALGVLAQAEVAAHWGAGPGQVELAQGALSGISSMIGCVVGGYGCVRLGGRVSYAVTGALMAAVTLAMAYLPAIPTTYIAGTLTYALVNGLCYAAFSTFVFEVIGGKLAATKYNGFASLSNSPITYMGLVLAAAETRFGPRGMLLTESAAGVLGILVFAAVDRLWRVKPQAIAGAAA